MELGSKFSYTVKIMNFANQLAISLRTEALNKFSEKMGVMIDTLKITKGEFNRMPSYMDKRNWVRNYVLFEHDRLNKEGPNKNVFMDHLTKLYENLEKLRKTKEVFFQ